MATIPESHLVGLMTAQRPLLRPALRPFLGGWASALGLSLAFGLGCAGGSGTAGSGGAPGSGGAVATGGATSSGGVSGTGGRASTGGAPGTGGALGTGGAPGTGGSANSGGSVGSGGARTGGATAGGGSMGSGGASTTDGGVGNSGGRAGASATGGNGAGGSTGDGGTGDAVPSAGCNHTSALKNNAYNTLGSRQYYLRLPASYDNTHPHRLILSLHGATGKGTDVAPGFWGLYALSNGSTIFIAPDAVGGLWAAASDTTFVDDILKAVEADLCIDTSRIILEGFSQGAAMSWTLACSRPGVFRAVVGHSGGGVANPSSCMPIAYFGSGGLQENVTQTSQTDKFARWNGCTVSMLPTAPTGGHVCTSYTGCPAADPVRWCNFDGPHSPSPTDSGKSSSWMPQEVWTFLSPF